MDVETVVGLLITRFHISPAEFGINLTDPAEVVELFHLLQRTVALLHPPAPAPVKGNEIRYQDIDAMLEVQ